MNPEEERIAAEAVSGAARGGLLASAASITSGLAVSAVPVKVLGLITIGTTTAISWPVVAALGVVGAITGGLAGALIEGKRQEELNEQFHRMLKG